MTGFRSLKKPVPVTRHKRLWLFWLIAIAGLVLPWVGISNESADADGQTINCKVNSVYDGDTLRATCAGNKIKVRLNCIDTPEMKQEPWGRISRDYLRSITPQNIQVASHGKDRYGRIIGDVIADGQNLNLQMVSSGHAAVYTRYCKDQQFYDAEEQARAAGEGIWQKPGLQQTPWEWRHSQ
jgi:endonuclease YncB( thermonuclease family)